MTFLIAVGTLCTICGVLATLLVIADRYFNDYGECKISINDGKKELTVQGGDTLLGSLTRSALFIPSACGGRGSCAMCKCKVKSGGPPLLATEEPHLTKEEISENVRLSCQVKVREDMAIEVPEELFSIREYVGSVEQIIDLNHDIKLLRLALPAGEDIGIVPGQYVQLQAPKYAKNKTPVYRAYSVASDPQDKTHVDLCVRRVPNGICTTYVFEHLQERQPVVFNGPYGDFRLTHTERDVVFIAGGSGMAPFLSMLAHIRNEGTTRNVTYFFGARARRDLICLDQMAEFERQIPTFRFVPCLSEPAEMDEWDGDVGLVTEVMKKYCEDLTEMEAYLCGSPGMIDASVAALTSRGMPEENIFFDKF
ncbi:NADH:ubiquinone reductase (Na(+)-transporting) subunit F [Verrucomicrobiota bacterium]